MGVEVLPHPDGILFLQWRYIVELLNVYNRCVSHRESSLATFPTYTIQYGTTLTDPTKFRMIIGIFQYLSFTHPNIVYVVNKLSHIIDHGFMFHRHTPLSQHAYSDLYWGNNKNEYTSTRSYLFYLERNPIFWSSKKQWTIACSSTEAKYRSVASTIARVH
ncbi:LOW QUALITY PROTEIN: hypothetical protein OSB04_001501 [Centaurea solstitialis]|uniref:Uncharacterized protein n=1 Tax=Centaurea solstitialis TaxID=347529 RepID=A0AA38WSQ2_9ASTR|nr:LOW QUALITY PROTEIN: hypothetical protein OSB04_001501 [Centaurea solstitialis]